SSPDLTSALSKVQLRIKHQTGPYWNPATATYDINYATAAWYDANYLSANCTYWSATKPTFDNNTSYYIEAIAYDKAGNTPVYVSTRTIKIDNVKPQSVVSFPVNTKSYKTFTALNTISGTSSDSETSVTLVKVYVKRNMSPYKWYYKDTAPDFSEDLETANNAASVAPWTLELLENTLTTGASYWAYTNSLDESGNAENLPGGASSYFIWDVTPPTSTVTNANILTGYVNNLPTISGSADDVTPTTPAGAQRSDGISDIEIQISTYGAAWSVITPWTNVTNFGVKSTTQLSTFTYTTSAPETISGKKYLLKTRSNDNTLPAPGNAENGDTKTGYTYVYDIDKPTSTVMYPVGGGNYGPQKSLATISGTVVDNPTAGGSVFNTGISTVQVRLYGFSEGKYYSGSAFNDATGLWRPCEVSGTLWKYPGNAGDTTPPYSDGQYQIELRSVDGSLNYESAITTITVKYDTMVPTSTLTMPNLSWHKKFATISGTAVDSGVGAAKADVKNVNITIKIVGGNYWDGDGFDTPTETWLASDKTWSDPNWLFTYPSGSNLMPNWGAGGAQSANGDKIEVKSKVYDNSDNYETPAAPLQIKEFIVDITTPTVLNIAPSTYTATVSNLPTISGTADDTPKTTYAGKIDTVRIRIREASKPGDATPNYWKTGTSAFDYTDSEGELAWFSPSNLTADSTIWWQPFTAWTDSGTYRLESKATDKAGNYILSYSTSNFTIDKSSPTSYVLIPASATTVSQFSSISGTGYDASGISDLKLKVTRLTDNYGFNGTNFAAGVSSRPVTQNNGYFNWQYTELTAAKLTNGVSYYVESYATDTSNPALTEVTDPARCSFFIYDTTAPVSSVLSVADNKAYSAITIASGSCADVQPSPSPPNAAYSNKISSVEISIQNFTLGTTYWNGTGWVEGVVWSSATNFVVGNSSWSYSNLTNAFKSGWQYKFKTRSYDTALPNNIQQVLNEYTVVYDTHPPVSNLTAPETANNNYGPSRILSTISGGSNDNLSTPNNAGVDNVKVRISTGTPAVYWNGTNWTGTSASWLNTDTSATNPFVFTSTPVWQNGKEYTVETRATDKVIPSGNVQLAYSTVTFRYDSVEPTSQITEPNSQFEKALTIISGTATADADEFSKVEQVQVQISSWTGAAYVVQQNWTVAQSSTAWTYPYSNWVNGTKYKVESRARDRSQNLQSTPNSYEFTYDISVPTVVVVAPNNGALNSSELASISGTALDFPTGSSPDLTSALSKVQLRIKHQTGPYWNPATATYDINYATAAWYDANYLS
ncbi:MAG: hypothetical protein HY746_10820, partial [Elusimicrobia bacterium]|nr:hypothetical protein [Elusimicrobiota bacterium]